MARAVPVILAFVILIVCLLHISLAELNIPVRNYFNDDGEFSMLEINSTRKSISQIVASIYDNDFDNFNKVMDYMVYGNRRRFKADVVIGLYETMKKVQHIRNPIRTLRLLEQVTDRLNDLKNELERSQREELENMKLTLTEENLVPQGARLLSAAIFMSNCDNTDSNVGKLLDYLYNEDDKDISNRVFAKMMDLLNCIVPRSELVRTLMNLSKHFSQNAAALVEMSKKRCNEPLNRDMQKKINKFLHNPKMLRTVSSDNQVQLYKLAHEEFELLDMQYICLSKMDKAGTLLYLQPCWNNSPEMCIGEKISYFRASFLNEYFAFKVYGGHWLNIPGQVEKISNLFGATNAESKYLWNVHIDEDRMLIYSDDKEWYVCGGDEKTKLRNVWFAYTQDAYQFTLNEEECKWYFRCSL